MLSTLTDLLFSKAIYLQCFDAVGSAAGRASGPVKKLEWWGTDMVICLERDADLHMAQLMPQPLTLSCFSKIQIHLPCKQDAVSSRSSSRSRLNTVSSAHSSRKADGLNDGSTCLSHFVLCSWLYRIQQKHTKLTDRGDTYLITIFNTLLLLVCHHSSGRASSL